MIPYADNQLIKDLDNVKKVLLSDYLTQGPEVKNLKRNPILLKC